MKKSFTILFSISFEQIFRFSLWLAFELFLWLTLWVIPTPVFFNFLLFFKTLFQMLYLADVITVGSACFPSLGFPIHWIQMKWTSIGFSFISSIKIPFITSLVFLFAFSFIPCNDISWYFSFNDIVKVSNLFIHLVFMNHWFSLPSFLLFLSNSLNSYYKIQLILQVRWAIICL